MTRLTGLWTLSIRVVHWVPFPAGFGTRSATLMCQTLVYVLLLPSAAVTTDQSGQSDTQSLTVAGLAYTSAQADALNVGVGDGGFEESWHIGFVAAAGSEPMYPVKVLEGSSLCRLGSRQLRQSIPNLPIVNPWHRKRKCDYAHRKGRGDLRGIKRAGSVCGERALGHCGRDAGESCCRHEPEDNTAPNHGTRNTAMYCRSWSRWRSCGAVRSELLAQAPSG